MDEHRQLLFVNQFLPSSEQKLIDRMRDAATRRITRPPEVTTILRDIPMDSIADVVVGPRYVGVLFTDGQISRYPYVATVRRLAPSASPATTATTTPSTASVPAAAPSSVVGGGTSAAPAAGSAAAAAGSFLQRTAKFRRYESNGRVLLAAGGGSSRGGRPDHRSVIIDRARPMLPASSVPEDLIAQAQVVLQGKTREVIIRELQRTNLNVNEAVNNLLSRDDDDDDGSEGAEMCIPEELLTLLDSSHGGVLESDLYPPDSFEYLMSSRERRTKLYDKEKEKKPTKPVIEANSDTETLRRYEIPLGSISEPWEGLDNKEAAVGQTPRFTHIACTQSEVLAISTDYKLYGWKWSEAAGDVNPHPMFEKMRLTDGEVLTHISACTLRVAVMTSTGRISSWLDTVACGERLSEALFVPPQKLQQDHQLEQLVVSNHLAVARYPNNVFYWCGLYPVNDRRRIFEKARTRQRKHVTFDTTQIVEGSEVRTKSGPIYSIGCIAANLSGQTPMVGILMENAWSLSEVCRFRLLDPSAYDSDRYDPTAAVEETEAESKEAAVAQHALTSGNRKRPATDEVFGGEQKMREEPWPISDVIFIHEEVQNDTAIVKIVDGGHCAVEYQEAVNSPTDEFATNASKQLASKGDKEKPKQKMRLIRKDELTVVSHKMRYARSPNSMRIEPYRFVLSGSTASKRVISAVADSLGIRALVERRGIASIVRISVCGKTLTSHPLPLHAPSLHSMDPMGGKPTLMNYGDDSILLLRDAHGGIIPLVRDAAAGFKEPTYMQLSASSYTALTVKSVKDKERPSWAPKANREAVIISMQGTHPRTLERRLPSLLYAVMCCDDKAVKGILDILHKEEDLDLSKREIVDARADGNRNILHAAVMNSFASKNSLEADVENPANALSTPETRNSADQVRATLDKKWNEMLRTNRSSNRSSSASTISTGAVIVSDSTQTATDSTQNPTSASLDILVVPSSQMGEVEIKMEIDDSVAPPLLINPSPIENPKQRQENSIAIVQMIVTHPICMPFLTDLLSGRDISGQTPFMAAVNHRAYSAARSIFKAVQSLFVHPEQGKWNSSMGDHLLPFLFPVGARPDDSPLFILCYNDPCSFTWTGDEHINQDIFECRTCGLTGSLCCCTECAFTCHRNHDCKLKRTSPTAYCDCWEKSCCNALVNGNQHAREELLKSLVMNSNLYTMLNGRGEHILLFLARKLARQQSEQWNYTRRPRRVQAPASGRDSHVPEHDLDPPKFARTALVYCLRNWSVIRSLAMIGVRQMDHSMPMAEEIFHLNNQHGSSHLDKFMLIILSKCSDEQTEMLEALLKVLTEQHNKARKTGENLEEVNFVISRFVRSVARLFILAVIISSAAASTAVSGLSPSKESSSILDRPSIRGITFSGIFGHLRKETTKDSKLKNMGMFIVRCKAFFEHFSVFALHEMAQLADASLAPVRTGILRPCVSLAALLGSTADSIENLEKYINSEPDVTQQMGVRNDGDGEQREERRDAKKRRKRSSRRDTDREEATSERAEGTAVAAVAAGAAGEGTAAGGGGGDRTAFRAPPPAAAGSSDSESDSDSDGEGFSSRRHASQSSALAVNEERNERTNDESMNEERRERERNNRFGAFLDQFRSSDDEDEEDEEVDSDSDGEQREGEEDEDEDEELLEGEEGGEDDDGDNDELATSEGDPPQPTESSLATRRPPPYDPIASRDYAMRRIRRDEEDERRRRREEEDEDDESSTNNWIPPAFDMPEDYNRPVDRGGSSEGSASSPAYSSLSEGEEERPEGHRHRRRRPKATAAAAADNAAAAADGGVVQPSQQGEQANADPVAPLREERNEQRDEDGDVDMADVGQVEVEVSETRDGTEYNEIEERDGSARTRPEGSAPLRGHSHTTEELEALQAEAAAMAAVASVRAATEREERERREDDDEWTEERRRHEEFIATRGRPAGRMTARRGGIVPAAPAPPRSTAQRGRRNPTTRGGAANSGEGRTERSDDIVTTSTTAPSDRGGRTAGGWSYRRPPWITRSLGEAEARRTARDREAARAEGEGESGSSSEEKKTEVTAVKEDETPTTLKAAIQLSAAFSFAVRMIGELLPIVAAGSTHAAQGLNISPNAHIVFVTLRDIEQLNEMEESVRRRAIDHVVTRLEDSWRWLAVVLDHTEAQIKYINAVTATEESKKRESKEKKKSSQRRKSPHGDRGADPSSSSTPSTTILTSPQSVSKVKRETISCLLGILRAHSGEGGDDIPLVDLDTLRAPALVVDAYLGFVDAQEEAEKLFELGKTKVSAINELLGPIEVEKEQEGILGMRRFYQRSNSVSFPGVSFTDAHDTLQLPCGQALPIVERPQLLTSTVDKEVIFGPPASTQERTKEEHDKVIRAHGVSHPHNQSLTAAPISSHRLFVEGEEEEKEVEKMEAGDHSVQPIAPIVIPSVASAPAKMDEMADNEEKKEKKEKKSKRGRKRGNKGDMKESIREDEVIVIDVESTQQSKEDEESSSSSAPPSSTLLSVVLSAPSAVVAPDGFETVTYEEILETFKSFREHPLRKLMGRWRFALQLIAKELHSDLTDTLGGDLSGSRLLRELAGFEMKQHELRARMEKYRATGSKDLSLEVHRDSALLVRETCHQLNRAFTRRIALKKYDKKEDAMPTLASHKVKVRFIDEPGEGTGVARSYYTALAEALASLKSLPFTDYGYKEGNDEYLYGGPMKNSESSSSSSVVSGSGRRIALIRGRDTFYATVTSSSSRAGRVLPFDRRLPLNYLHPPYSPESVEQAEYHKVDPEYLARLREDSFIRENGDKQLDQFNDRLFILIRGIYPAAASRITGMFMDLPLSHIVNILNDPNTLRAYLADAVELMMEHGAPTDLAMLKDEDEKKDVVAVDPASMEPDDAPLFFRPSKKAHYSPVPGRLSPARINAFRNVGRVIGLCLTQCEMFPLRLSRHVLKYILGRPLNWHDFAFYDPQMFESMRTLIVEGSTGPNPQEYFDALSLNFTMDMPHDSTGVPSSSMELCPGGTNKEVTKENIVEYVYCYVEQRLLGKNNRKCLAAIKQGVQDVLPQSMLDNLTAEDLRLVLCGTETVSLSMMQSYTTWTDESHAVPETIAKFKQWFWQVADRLSPSEKQDLIFFWTGAPSLPSTEEGFQPLPTIVIRPTDDGFLPTANTCISRLYLPLYNSKKTLTAKLQLAIKAKNFGFV